MHAIEGLAIDGRIALEQVERALVAFVLDFQRGARRKLQRGIEARMVLGDRRARAIGLAHDQVQLYARPLDHWQRRGGDMLEGRGDFFEALGQRKPGLDSVQPGPEGAFVGRRALAVADPAPRGHQIDRARLDPLDGAEAVAMIDRALEQIGDGGQVDVRVGSDVDPLVDPEARRAHLVEENKRSDHGPELVRQGAVDLEPAEVVADRREAHEDWRLVGHSPGAFVSIASAWTWLCISSPSAW